MCVYGWNYLDPRRSMGKIVCLSESGRVWCIEYMHGRLRQDLSMEVCRRRGIFGDKLGRRWFTASLGIPRSENSTTVLRVNPHRSQKKADLAFPFAQRSRRACNMTVCGRMSPRRRLRGRTSGHTLGLRPCRLAERPSGWAVPSPSDSSTCVRRRPRCDKGVGRPLPTEFPDPDSD